MPASFQAAASGLRAKRRALSKGLSEYIQAIKEEGLPTIEAFRIKRDQFEKEWNDVVKANNNCLSLLNAEDEQEVKKMEEEKITKEGKEQRGKEEKSWELARVCRNR